MNFLSWLFSLERRHRFGVRAFAKGGAGIRVFTMLMYAVLFCAALGLEYLAISNMLSGEVLGVLILILAILVGLAAVEYCSSYSFVGELTASTHSSLFDNNDIVTLPPTRQ